MSRPVSSGSQPAYLPFPLALERLRKRLGASPHEVAAWLFLSGRARSRPEGMPAQSESALTPGPERGDLRAYLHANELEEPPRFSFDALLPDTASAPLDYLAPLAACWFRREDLDRFVPEDRFITGSDLVARWSGVTDLDIGAFIRAKIIESCLSDLHPITGGTRAALPSDPTLPPMESGLFALSEIEAIEREDLALEGRGPRPGAGAPARDAKESSLERRERLIKAVAAERGRGIRNFLKVVAEREGITKQRLQQLIKPPKAPQDRAGARWSDPFSRASKSFPTRQKTER
jgi:hypothetical protein